jgi:hypothetical protein
MPGRHTIETKTLNSTGIFAIDIMTPGQVGMLFAPRPPSGVSSCKSDTGAKPRMMGRSN